MNRGTSAVAVVGLLLGALFGFLGSLPWSGSREALNDALETRTRLERQLSDLRAENDRMAAQLEREQAQAQTVAGDLRREKEQNMRLHMLVSEGRK
jgi:hypothetical protein